MAQFTVEVLTPRGKVLYWNPLFRSRELAQLDGEAHSTRHSQVVVRKSNPAERALYRGLQQIVATLSGSSAQSLQT